MVADNQDRLQDSLGEAIDALATEIDARALADPEASYTAQLIAQGPGRCAKKLGEEGVELALAIASGEEASIRGEAADLLYHFLVALKSVGVAPAAVAAELASRRGTSGLAEKANRTSA